MPGHAVFDARVPDHEHGKHDEQAGGNRQAKRIGAAGKGPDQAGGRRQEHAEARARDAGRAALLHVAGRGVRVGTRVIRNRHAAFRAEMLSRQ